MAQRVFRSDDTSAWADKFGTGSDGAKTVSSNETYDGARASCSGTASTTSLTLGAASTFANGDIVIIHQTRGTGAGTWELNRISSGGGGTSLTMAYTLINTYTDSGDSQAQIVEIKQYSAITVNGSTTWSAPEWDGDTGGIIAVACTGTTAVTGTISASGTGFRGGAKDIRGESYSGQVVNTHVAGANNGGGGSCTADANENGGSGAGYATAGSAGTGISGSFTGGSTYGGASLVALHSGSGGGGSHAAQQPGKDGGGMVLIISKTITVTGAVVSNGATNGNESQTYGLGGSGSGGSVLLKGQIITLGSSLVTATGGATSTNAGAGGDGGAGGNGRIHADYSATLTGTTSPTLDSSQDGIFNDNGGSFVFNMI